MSLTKEQKVIHLLNRFGLGACQRDLDIYLPLGIDGAVDRLVNYEKVPSAFSVQPSELYFYNKEGNTDLGPHRVAIWWLMRMIMTQRPMQEKLTLFWHNHFAVSASKIEFGPPMQLYLQALHENANGKFNVLLDKVAKTPAMVKWLDTDTSLKGRPNENFARELMELFTLGIGNYTEADVKSAAKAFSGWSLRYPGYELGNNTTEATRVRYCVEHDMPFVVFIDAPDLHDNSFKTVVGKSGALTAEDIMGHLAHHPVTAKRMVKKLWEFFAYTDPEPALIERLAKVWTQSDLDVRKTMIAIAESPEFWSPRAVGTMVKSPVDYAVGLMRQVGLDVTFKKRRKEFASYDTPMDGLIQQDLFVTFGSMSDQGLRLLAPPDVSGWRWGPAWISAAATLDRIRFAGYAFYYRSENSPSDDLMEGLLALGQKASAEAMVTYLLHRMALKLPIEKQTLLVEVTEKHGAGKLLKDKPTASYYLTTVGKIIVASPEYQLC
jgi:uncharacterized protein (DUF1800 family)